MPTFIEVWTQCASCKVTPEERHVNFAQDILRLYFDECQKNEDHLLYLHFFFVIWEVLKYM